jgi:hypothetical protein
MKTDQHTNAAAVFLQTISIAMARLKQQLQRDYEKAYPALREIIHIVLDEEETNAWRLSTFPHLLLPDLVEAHIANLNLQPAKTKHDHVFRLRQHADFQTLQPTFALCG